MPRLDPDVAPARAKKPTVRPVVKVYFETKSAAEAHALVARLNAVDGIKPHEIEIAEGWGVEWDIYDEEWEPYDFALDEEGADEDDIDV